MYTCMYIQYIVCVHLCPQMPFIAVSMTQNSSNNGHFQLFMRPVYTDALLDVIINKYGWERIIYIYDTDEGTFGEFNVYK